MSVPAGTDLDRVQPASVQATLRGRRRDFLFLDEGDLTLELDASHVTPGRRRLSLKRSDVSGPSGVRVQALSPASVEISVRPRRDGG